MGGGYEGLAACCLAVVGWGCTRGPRFHLAFGRELTPIQVALAPFRSKLRYPSPIKGEGSKKCHVIRPKKGCRVEDPDPRWLRRVRWAAGRVAGGPCLARAGHL